MCTYRERKYDSFNGITACAFFGGPGMLSGKLVPRFPSLPRRRGAMRYGGFQTQPLLTTCCLRRGRARGCRRAKLAQRGSEARTLRSGAVFAPTDNLFLSFSRGAFFLWGTQEGSRLSVAVGAVRRTARPGSSGAAAALAAAGSSPLPLFGTSQTFLSWLLGSAGGGERWGRGDGSDGQR